jgi:CheY-like chemotaxis protein
MGVKRVLIVDDEEDIREVAKASLELTAGWEVLTARSGPECLRVAESEQPDAILLDVMMPVMDGPAVFRRLQANQNTCHVPVVLLTAKQQSTDRRRYLELGVSGVLAKPFDPLELAAEISRILGW